jgi:protein disulfide-isomerase
MNLKSLGFGMLVLAASLALSAAPRIGDSYDAVIAAKGQPTGQTSAGSTLLLNYPDVIVTLREGKVVSVKALGAIFTVPERKLTAAERRQAAAVAAPAPVVAASAEWSTDAATALAQAKAQGRHVFLFFTGSDWCGWCIRLNREILNTSEFIGYAQDKLVLVELDFPQRKQQSDAVRAQNAKLAKKYGIRGYPTVVVLDGDGKVVGKLGYQPGGPGPFIAALDRM